MGIQMYWVSGYPGTRFNTRLVPGFLNTRKSENYCRLTFLVSSMSNKSALDFFICACTTVNVHRDKRLYTRQLCNACRQLASKCSKER